MCVCWKSEVYYSCLFCGMHLKESEGVGPEAVVQSMVLIYTIGLCHLEGVSW